MNAKNLGICSVALVVLLATSGCYTVFQRKTIDGKPPADITEDVMGEYSGDIVFHDYPHQRWSHYLLCPWWEESVFSRFHRIEHQDAAGPSVGDGSVEDNTLYIPFPASEPTVFRHGVRTSSTPSAAPKTESGDIRHKPEDDSSASEPLADEPPEAAKKPAKPDRRAGPGGKR